MGGQLLHLLTLLFSEACKSSQTLRGLEITPHVSQNLKRRGGSAIDGRTTRHAGYEINQRVRKQVEEPFGWATQIGGLQQTKFRGLERVRQAGLAAGDGRLQSGAYQEFDTGCAVLRQEPRD